jgi:hypothetical protein
MFKRTAPDRQLIISAYSLTSDKAGSALSVKESDGKVATVDAICASGQKVITISEPTAGWSTDVIVVQRADGTMERHLIASVQEDVSLTTTVNLAAALGVGDKVYRVTESYKLPVGAATATAIGDGPLGYLAGNVKTGPVLFDLDGTSTCSINFLTGFYL